jgi:hypothetical protein
MLRGRPALGFTSSLGRVPTPVKPAKRVSPQERIPILDERIQLWLLAQGAEIEGDVIPCRKGGSPNSSGARYPKADRWKRV